MKRFKQLTERERYLIEYMRKEKKTVPQIARELGRHHSTIYRELRKGTVEQLGRDLLPITKYCADSGQRVHDERKHLKGAPLKIGSDIAYLAFIGEKIKNDKYSPQAALDYIRVNGLVFKTQLTRTTIYRYIDEGLFLGITNDDLPVKTNKKKKEIEKRTARNHFKGRSIEERDKSISKRMEYGHWEMDTVYPGKEKGKACILALSERKFRREILFKIPDRTQDSVKAALDRMEKEMGVDVFRQTFKTITCDNGVEFLEPEKIENAVTKENETRTTLYYCHPFRSGERGTNENINRMIRRWIPKGSSMDELTDEELRMIENWINDFPRRIFNGKSSNQVYREYLETYKKPA